jgi:large subunit ribosomal protein L15
MDISKAKKLTNPRSRKHRIGRGTGSRRGKTSGRGMNGARSRSGWSSRGINGGSVPLWRRMPKRGFSNEPHKTVYTVVNIGQLEQFDADTEVTVETLREAGIVGQTANGGIKILGGGELTKALSVSANAFSKSAAEKIQAAGGSVNVIEGPKPPVRNKMGHGARGTGAASALESMLEGE